jgi:uncharacterized membrane protein
VSASHAWTRVVRATVAVVATTMVLDLVFLGIVAKPLYDAWLGPLRAREVYWPAALAFYAMYVGATLRHAVLPATSRREAARRGAELGFVAYATYELTNWAVLAGWPSALVPVDLAWGVVLTATSAAAGRAALGEGAPASSGSSSHASSSHEAAS